MWCKFLEESHFYEIWFERADDVGEESFQKVISQLIGAQNWQQRQEQVSAYSFNSSHHIIRILEFY
jgi:hypothetical protein